MSWLARSIANSLKFDDDNDGGDDVHSDHKIDYVQKEDAESQEHSDLSPTAPSRGLQEDLSELSRTLTRQFRGFASFLAPPPPAEQKSEDTDVSGSDKDPSVGIRDDFAEIGGRFKTGITRLSNNMKVSEITKLASSFLHLESDDENVDQGNGKYFANREFGAVGVTTEVVNFASDISTHPEIWLDFQRPVHDEDEDDFDISDEQQEHALAVERLVPRLAALRMELSPQYMSETRFWRTYFVLVHTRLSKEDALILSTPQVMEARALLETELKIQNQVTQDESLSTKSPELEEEIASFHHVHPLSVPAPNLDKSPPAVASESPDIAVKENKPSVISSTAMEEKDASKLQIHEQKHNSANLLPDEDVDDWLRDEATEPGVTLSESIPTNNDDDVSFSDLEEEDGEAPTVLRESNTSSDRDAREWVQLGKSPKDAEAKVSDATKESSDWLDVVAS